jgi:hypothetical protein
MRPDGNVARPRGSAGDNVFFTLGDSSVVTDRISARKDDPQPRLDLTIDGDALSACFNDEMMEELR